MKLKKNLSRVFTLDSNNNFVYEKNKNLSKELKDFTDIIVDFYHANYDIVPHSIYLRGSCLERDIDKDTRDIDLIVVHENEFIEPALRARKRHQPLMMQKMEDLHGFSLTPDIDILYRNVFLASLKVRFYCMKVWGKEDLSVSTVSYSKFNTYFDNYNAYFFKGFISEGKTLKNTPTPRKVGRFIKKFFRDFGGKILIKNGKITRDVYVCYEALLKKYPEYSKEFNSSLKSFLNIESYSKQEILDSLSEVITLARCIHYGKPPSYILEVYDK